MIDVALLLPKILAGAGDNADLSEISAKIAWRRIAGEGLRDHAVPIRLQEKTLVVSVADAVWQKQLHTMSAELIFRINKLLRQNVVDRIAFRIDARAAGRATARGSSPRVHEPLPTDVVSSAAGITDPELRERFMRAASNCIERRETLDKDKFEIRKAGSSAGQPG